MEEKIYCEAICDFIHVHPAALKMLINLKGSEHVLMVSDSVETCGLPDGECFISGIRVIKKNGAACTESGALWGGSTTLTDGVRNLVSIGISLEDAVSMASKTPSRWLGVNSLTAIEKGGIANLLGLNEKLYPELVVIEKRIYSGLGGRRA